MNMIKTLVAASALALTGLAHAELGPGENHLGLLTSVPTQFSRDVPATANYVDFLVAAPSDLTGTLTFLSGQASFQYLSLYRLGPVPVVYPAGTVQTSIPWSQFTELVPSGSGYTFEFKVVEAGEYRLLPSVPFGSGLGAYSASILATPAVPEPQTILLMLAGLGVAVVVARRRSA